MMRVALAVLGDSFRLLRARKMFGISMLVSLMIGVLYASIGFDDEGMSLFFGLKKVADPNLAVGSENAAAFYIMLFTDVIVRFWLAWIVLLLALISTISIFPDFLAEGSIGVSLSKPVSRTGLFLLKYLGALLFVAVQVGVLALIAFIAIGWRLGEWNAGIFWAIPVVTFVFSLIYGVSVLAAVWTKSTAFSLLAGLGVWGTTLLVQWAEDTSYKMEVMLPELGTRINPQTGEFEVAEDGPGSHEWQTRFESIMAPLPKTRACTLYLKRLIVFEDRDSPLSGMDLSMVLSPQDVDPALREAMERYESRHSAWYVFGTSAVFELVVLGAALLVFIRRDY
jgi:ABC-type transport system involved in multi-copper enzyme maturation permease subunit